MILYIAEKPSLGRALAEALPKPQQKCEGYIRLGNGDLVSWCIGHLLEQAEPEAYSPDYKKWAIEHLPIVPTEWKLEVKPQTSKQFHILKKLIKQADLLVNVGDPDREGQILVDEVINYCGVSKSKRESAKRCLISDLNTPAVKQSLAQLRDNKEFVPLATSALARARADWLYGINMTRLCTLRGQASGYSGVLSIGRVQTPLLGLVVNRDLEIENFVSKPFYEVWITLNTAKHQSYLAKWKPSEACEPYMDEEGRVLSKKLAENVIKRVEGQQGVVTQVSKSRKKQAAPLPYNLSALQIDAAKRFAYSAKQVLDGCQQLYETYKLITYPRSDCRYLPKGHLKDKQAVTEAISNSCNALTDGVKNADLSITSKAWNDSKVGAHHAIIPTSRSVGGARLSKELANLYELIARQYLIQFYPPFEYEEKQIDTEVAGGLFIAKQKEVRAEGWKALFPSRASSDKEEGAEEQAKLPNLVKGESVDCIAGRLDEKQTTPPKHFNDASLLSAMTGIARFVSDAEIKKVLRETDGLGTEATRASIIELLFRRNYLSRQGREIRATEIGKTLIRSLPDRVTEPDMTAHWESRLDAIKEKTLRYNDFMQPLTEQLGGLIAEISHARFDNLRGLGGTKPRKKSSSAKKTTPKRGSSRKKGAGKA